MPRRYAVVCDDELSEAVEALSREYDLTEQEVLRQLLRRGLEACEDVGAAGDAPGDGAGALDGDSLELEED